MAETEHITVADVSEGPGGSGTPGTSVSLPVVEILTGRGFVTGKSGSGKSNSASVIAENLLDSNFGLLIVDVDGEYYGLKEAYEILHVGGDEECDIQVTTDHAEKIASLALEQNVPIILDVSSYLDESDAEELLTAVARSLFAKAKKRKQPFLLLVEEIHEYIPEKGSVGECGKMLIKISKRGRKHGLGICGISQRPADVKKDFITQCDWLLWHRLTWNNDTKVVRRILDGEYAAAVEDLDDGEGFLTTDWSGSVRRVQFHRKETFDAGATPGLEDFERPDLKSVSEDLVSELQDISEEQQERESRIAELREELDRKNSRIAELETELQDARDLRRMAEQFVGALVEHVEGAAPGRTEKERMADTGTPGADLPDGVSIGNPGSAGSDAESDDGPAEDGPEEAFAAMAGAIDGGDAGRASGTGTPTGDENADPRGSEWPAFGPDESTADAGDDPDGRSGAGDDPDGRSGARDHPDSEFSAEEILSTFDAIEEFDSGGGSGRLQTRGRTSREEVEITLRSDAEFVGDRGETGDEEPLVLRELKADIAGMETKTRKMLSFYREFGPATPLNAHFAAGGDENRTVAYAHNRTLRTAGLIEHVGRGRYDSRLRHLLAERIDGPVDDGTLDACVREIESTAIET